MPLQGHVSDAVLGFGALLNQASRQYSGNKPAPLGSAEIPLSKALNTQLFMHKMCLLY